MRLSAALYLCRGITVPAREPCDKACLGLVRVAGEVRPFVGDDERALDVEQIGRHEGLEEEGIGHAGDRHLVEISAEQRGLGPARHDHPRRSELALGLKERSREARGGERLLVRGGIQAVEHLGIGVPELQRGLATEAPGIEHHFLEQRQPPVVQPPEGQERQIRDRPTEEQRGGKP